MLSIQLSTYLVNWATSRRPGGRWRDQRMYSSGFLPATSLWTANTPQLKATVPVTEPWAHDFLPRQVYSCGCCIWERLRVKFRVEKRFHWKEPGNTYCLSLLKSQGLWGAGPSACFGAGLCGTALTSHADRRVCRGWGVHLFQGQEVRVTQLARQAWHVSVGLCFQ